MSSPRDGTVDREALRAKLAASRAALMRALEGMTEREFAAEFEDGMPVVRALAELAGAERAAVVRARGPVTATPAPEKPLPPQVVHDLAGARHRTEQAIAAGDAPGLAAIVDAIAEREAAVAARLEALKGHA